MRSSFRIRIALSLLVLVVVAVSIPATFAQETTTGVQGYVRDQTGAVFSNAKVEISSPSLIGTRKAETDSTGFYRFVTLPPGDYTDPQGVRTLPSKCAASPMLISSWKSALPRR